ncbi:MAG: patatin-like phospholipase family protein [Chloroflexota bacterium]|nr:patatin-like phospholipase family protein [Chloroflexota bacterium]
MRTTVAMKTPEEYAHRTYLAKPENKRRGVALRLSGGGFRAALFHLGALRRLNELGVLSRVDTISCVSGGSIVGAFLAEGMTPWPGPGEVWPHWDDRVSIPFYSFAARNLRTGPLVRRYLLPWNWLNGAVAVQALEESYRQRVTGLSLGQLPDHPAFVFSAADLVYGVNWTFRQDRIGDYQAGWSRQPAYPLARAVAASSCFPPVFDPMVVGLGPDELKRGQAERKARSATDPERRKRLMEARDKLVAGLRLSDGGLYDNMGLEPVWKGHEVVLVSDGGETLDFEPDRGPILRLPRYASILDRQ